MSPPSGPRDDDPTPRIVYRRKPGDDAQSPPAGASAPHGGGTGSPAAAGPEAPGILAAREAMRLAAAREESARLRTLEAGPASPTPIPASRARTGSRTGLVPFALAAVNILLAAACLLGVRHFTAARAWEETLSYDLGEEQASALTGLGFLAIAASVAAAGFAITALGLLSRSRLGRRVAMIWASVCTLTILGAVYGVPSLLLLRSRGPSGPTP